MALVSLPDLAHPVLPMALSAPTTLDYRAASDAMEAVHRRYRVAFASNSLAGLTAIARSGHAISVLTQMAVPPDLHVVSARLPPLPTIGIAVEFADSRPSSIVRALGDHIRTALPTLLDSMANPRPADAATGASDRPGAGDALAPLAETATVPRVISDPCHEP